MILETCQLLCCAVHLHGDYTPCYKLTHKNHPCSIWVRESINNYKWLCYLGKELCTEYTYRYGKIHKCEQYINDLTAKPPNLPNIKMTPIKQAMPDNYKHINPVIGYRTYYLIGKKDLLSWKGKIKSRESPFWVKCFIL